MAIAAGLFLLPALRLAARQRHKGHPAPKHKIDRKVQSADKPVKRHYTRHPSTHQTTRRGAHHVRRHHRQSRLHLQPERVKEIQQALARSGYLHEEPTGRWDQATRDAMQQYQQANGFSGTGLPEAKPLMKLGLGPHPLPPGLQPPASVNAGIQSNMESSSLANSSPPANSSSQAQ
jgi:peptidoglycan hydrolase-like protein with peptidoglycan-binding domain